MKRIILVSFVIIFMSAINCFSQNFDLKYYEDYSNDFSGVSAAAYLGTIDDEKTEKTMENFIRKLPDTAKNISKLTKNNMWLCKKALNEWEYEEGECYLVCCAESRWARNCILLIVTILGKDDFDWLGISLSEDDLKEMGKKQEE